MRDVKAKAGSESATQWQGFGKSFIIMYAECPVPTIIRAFQLDLPTRTSLLRNEEWFVVVNLMISTSPKSNRV